MAQLTIKHSFSAIHGTSSRCVTLYEIQVAVNGNIILGFTNHCDSTDLERRLCCVCNDLEGAFLDELMGRATHEMVAIWIFHHIRIAVDQVIVSGDGLTVAVDLSDYLQCNFESLLAQQKATRAFLFGDFDVAKKLLAEAIEKDPENFEARLIRGRVFRFTGEYELAVVDFTEVIRKRPQWSEGYRNMGNVLLFQNQYQKMIPYFQEAVRLAPYSSLAVNNLGYACGLLDRWEEAYHYCQQAIELNPDYYEAYIDLASACENLHKHSEAKHYRETAKQLEIHLNLNDPGRLLADPEDTLVLSSKTKMFPHDTCSPQKNDNLEGGNMRQSKAAKS